MKRVRRWQLLRLLSGATVPSLEAGRNNEGAIVTGLHTTPNVQKAVAFFTQAGLSRLLAKVREKYIEVGQVGGQIILQESTPSERREIASFLGKPPYAHSSLKVKLVDVEKTLKHSFDCTLPELLSAFFPDQPLVTRQAKRSAHALHQADFRVMLLSIATTLPAGSRGGGWLEQQLFIPTGHPIRSYRQPVNVYCLCLCASCSNGNVLCVRAKMFTSSRIRRFSRRLPHQWELVKNCPRCSVHRDGQAQQRSCYSISC